MGLLGKIKGFFNRQAVDEETVYQPDWEEERLKRDDVDMHDKTQREQYVKACMEQMSEASKELDALGGEYNLVTSYLSFLSLMLLSFPFAMFVQTFYEDESKIWNWFCQLDIAQIALCLVLALTNIADLRETIWTTHAMMIAGVNLVDGKPDKWKIENSWGTEVHGKKVGHNGYYVCGDEWFDNFVYEVAIKKSLLSDELQKVLDTEPIVWPFWCTFNPVSAY